MYVSLVYYLRHDQWISPDDYPNLVKPYDFWNGTAGPGESRLNWMPFYFNSTEALRPYESCDCWRPPGKVDIVENRYYHDPVRNNTVVYYQGFGHRIPIRGHWKDPNQILNDTNKVGPWDNATKIPPFQFKYTDWADAIINQVLPIKPHTLVMNAGLWHNNFGNTEIVERLVNATKSIPQVIWKTTTVSRDKEYSNSVDQSLCNTLECMNVSGWTFMLDEDYYTDGLHFREPIYHKMNEQLLWDHVFPHHYSLKYQDYNQSMMGQIPWSELGIDDGSIL
jgi:hypothetical protein